MARGRLRRTYRQSETAVDALQLAAYWERRLDCVASWQVSQEQRPLADSLARILSAAARRRVWVEPKATLIRRASPSSCADPDNGPEFVAAGVHEWLGRIGVKTLYIEPGSPWENGYCEGFNSKLRDELLNGEIFTTLREAQVLIEGWRRHYNAVRPHSSLGYRPPFRKRSCSRF